MNTLLSLSTYRFDSSFLRLFQKLGEYRGELVFLLQQPAQMMNALKQSAWLESVEYSNRLDGVDCSRRVIARLVSKEFRPLSPEERQVAGYSDALDLVLAPAEHLSVSNGLICQLHALLYGHVCHEGGRWRPTNKEIIERDSSGKIIGILYRTVSPSQIDSAMAQTGQLLRQYGELGVDPVLLIAAVTLDLLCIHPFSDGNGRISRLLTVMLLALNGDPVGQYVSLDRMIFQRQQDYILALKKSAKGWHTNQHDPLPWIAFFLELLIDAHQSLKDRIMSLRQQGGKAPKTRLVHAVINEMAGVFSVSDISLQLPSVSREMIKKVIQDLREQGALQRRGKGRGSCWEKCE
ncbi:Adenosine monophosphate-protein transferase SoFic [invertebrate metagenome]|uniref:Adenosine monophosphate-protein transferase SoFic n=1 Tax=invertebrate metagenome TaxID=1711999 RepID=A0A2H9T3Z1_9ZZZZ